MLYALFNSIISLLLFNIYCSTGNEGEGHLLQGVVRRTFVARRPGSLFVVEEARCFGCAACLALCPVDALILDDLLAVVDEPKCTHCELCIPACPVFALSIVSE